MTLRNLLPLALLLLIPGLTAAAPPGWQKLLTPTELAAQLHPGLALPMPASAPVATRLRPAARAAATSPVGVR